MTASRSLAGELVTGTSSGRTFCLELEVARHKGFRKFRVPLGLITCRLVGSVTGLDWIDTGSGLDSITISGAELLEGSARDPASGGGGGDWWSGPLRFSLGNWPSGTSFAFSVMRESPADSASNNRAIYPIDDR